MINTISKRKIYLGNMFHYIFNVSSKSCKIFSKQIYRTISNTLKNPPGNFIDIGSHKIHYEKLGHGKHHLFLIPGGMGSARNDWTHQLETLDKNKFTLIAWDPPGFGFSQGDNYYLCHDLFHKDAEVAGLLLKALGIRKTSIMGWCGGGITSIITAAQNLDIIDKLVLVSVYPRLDNDVFDIWKDSRDVNLWSPVIKDPLIELHGFEYVQTTWDNLLHTFRTIINNGKGDFDEMKQIHCPTLIIHSNNDKFVPFEKAQVLRQMISNSKFVEFKDGNHHPHFHNVEKFNQIVQEFLLEQ